MKYKPHLDSIHRVNNKSAPCALPRLHAGERSVPFTDDFLNDFLATLTPQDFINYPDTNILKERLAEKHGVTTDNIFLASGSDYVLQTLFNVFVEPNTEVAMPEAHFPMYDVYLNQNQGKAQLMQYSMVNGQLTLNPTITGDPRLIVIANPNSPVGDIIGEQQYREWAKLGSVLVIDQAYGEFGKTDLPIDMIEDNVVFVNTFSKAHGAAGIRVGYAVANARIIELMSKFRQMFAITSVSAKFALYLLDNEHVLNEYTNAIIHERERLKSIGIQVQGGNWVHVKQADYQDVAKYYKVRSDVRLPLIDDVLLRITITPGLSEVLHEFSSFTNLRNR